jgi:lysine-N-methylase
MSLFAPAYYPAFRCIAGDCAHSCCIGWEIGIDPATLARYKALPPKERKAIFAHTVTQKGSTTFRLSADGRCPFLNNSGLCRLILTHGEAILCDICREHPRFYNLFSHHTEVGLGLCCEEAARLILTHPDPFALISLEESAQSAPADPFEADFFVRREEIFQILCDRSRPLPDRVEQLLANYSLSCQTLFDSDSHWQSVYRALERLHPTWDDALAAWEGAPPFPTFPDTVATEQLIAYFLHRHLTGALEDGRYGVRVAFALLSAHVISAIAAAMGGDSPLATLIDVARAYSEEVEYDEDNTAVLLNELDRLLREFEGL